MSYIFQEQSQPLSSYLMKPAIGAGLCYAYNWYKGGKTNDQLMKRSLATGLSIWGGDMLSQKIIPQLSVSAAIMQPVGTGIVNIFAQPMLAGNNDDKTKLFIEGAITDVAATYTEAPVRKTIGW